MSQLLKPEATNFCHPHFPKVLATTEELNALLGTDVIIVEADMDPLAYDHGHLPNARHWDWSKDLRNPETNEVIDETEFAALMARSGISNDSHVVLYGDNNNWFACWAYWVMKTYGHKNVRMLDGGINKWVTELRPIDCEAPEFEPSVYMVEEVDRSFQATSSTVVKAMFDPNNHKIIDVRSQAEYRGERLGPGAGMADTCAVGGHIPSALNIPWSINCNEDGTFKSPTELRDIYEDAGIFEEHSVITYCAIGERASLSWFVLKELLNYDSTMNYDRSMSYWSRLPNVPVIQGDAA